MKITTQAGASHAAASAISTPTSPVSAEQLLRPTGTAALTPTLPLPTPPQATTKALRASAVKLAASGQAAPTQVVGASVSVSGTATPPPTGEPAASTTVSVSGTSYKPSPSPIAYFLARLQDQDIDVVEAALVKFKDACLRGDHAVVEAALIEQATLLNAVGSTLVTNVGSANTMEQKQVWASLGLRSLEMSRKSLELVISSRGRRGPQTSDSAPTNDLVVPRG